MPKPKEQSEKAGQKIGTSSSYAASTIESALPFCGVRPLSFRYLPICWMYSREEYAPGFMLLMIFSVVSSQMRSSSSSMKVS